MNEKLLVDVFELYVKRMARRKLDDRQYEAFVAVLAVGRVVERLPAVWMAFVQTVKDLLEQGIRPEPSLRYLQLLEASPTLRKPPVFAELDRQIAEARNGRSSN